MTLFKRGRCRSMVVGLGVLAVSLVGLSGPAAAAPAATRTVLTTSTASVAIGEEAKLKAVVKPVSGTLRPAGTVTFTEGLTVVGTVPLTLVGTAQTAKLTVPNLAVGSHDFVATYNGSIDFSASTSLTVRIVVGRAATTATATTSTPIAILEQNARVKVVVRPTAGSGRPTGAVVFKEGGTTLGKMVALSLVGNAMTATLTIATLPLGTHGVVASYSGSPAFGPATSSAVSVNVVKGDTTTTLTATENDTTPGKYVLVALAKASAPATGPVTGTMTFTIDSNAPQIVELSPTGRAQISVTFVDGTSHTVKLSYSGDSRLLASADTDTLVA